MVTFRKHKKVTILWGLPGSGKTTYAEQTSGKSYRSMESCIIDVDNIGRYCQKYQHHTVDSQVGQDTVGKLHYFDHVIVDGLVTTNDVAARYMRAIKESAGDKYVIDFEIVWWTPDREACHHNDQGRRANLSTHSIDGMMFEEPLKQLAKEFKAVLVHKTVVRKPMHKAWSVKVGQGDQDEFESESWCLGGTHRNYNGDTYVTSPSPQPASFTRFDELLEEVCPTITFLQYKKICRECVTVKEYSESDYYGGTVNYAKYVCDTKKLYALLVELDIVKEE